MILTKATRRRATQPSVSVSNRWRRGAGRNRSGAWPGFALVVSLWLLAGCVTPNRPSATAEADVRAVLEQQVREWNAGNLAGFMDTYARSDQTHFASGGDLSLGWQRVFDRYRKKYGNPAGMGTTTFSDLEITVLAPDAALAFGRWHQKGDRGEGQGLFTLLLRKMPEGWRIVHDHTSAADKK